MNLEVIRRYPEGAEGRATAKGRPPLLFVHGAFSAAWVWDEHFLPYFAAAGWDCAAVSLRGHGGSEGKERLDFWGLEDFVADVADVADSFDRPPVLIGHSLGGLVAQRYAARRPVAGLALLASVGPGGLGGSITHMSLFHPLMLQQVMLMQTLGPDSVDFDVGRQGLFSPDMSPAEARRLMPRFQRESTRATTEAAAPQVVALAFHPPTPTLVIGGGRDAFVPQVDVLGTALFWSGQMVMLDDAPHVMMLDTAQWVRCAKTLLDWLEKL